MPIYRWSLHPNPVICWVALLWTLVDHASAHSNVSHASSIRKVLRVLSLIKIVQFACNHSYSLRDTSVLKLQSALNRLNGKEDILLVNVEYVNGYISCQIIIFIQNVRFSSFFFFLLFLAVLVCIEQRHRPQLRIASSSEAILYMKGIQLKFKSSGTNKI